MKYCTNLQMMVFYIPYSDEEEESSQGTGGDNVQTAILQALQRHNSVPTPTPLSGNEHFAMGLVPSLDRLPPEVLEYVKFQIRKVIFDQSNFTVQLEPI